MTFFNQKQSTFFLLAIVLVIWGGLSFRLIKSTSSTSVKSTPTNQYVNSLKTINKRDSYNIEPYNIDPFLGEISSPKKSIKKSIPEKETPPWPKIEYVGTFSSTKGERHLFKINQRTTLWEIGEKKQEMLLIKKGQFLEIIYKKRKKSFRLNLTNHEK